VTTGSQYYHAENFKEPKYHFRFKSQFHRLKIERFIAETLFLSDPVKDPALICLSSYISRNNSKGRTNVTTIRSAVRTGIEDLWTYWCAILV
jgi:hypothetical protein